MMRKQDRLGSLQVRIARHHHIQMSTRLFQEHPLEPTQTVEQSPEGVPKIQADIQSHLVVPAAACVQFAADRSDQFRQSPLDRHVNIFIIRRKRKAPRLELAPNLLQSAQDLRGLLPRQHPGPLQRLAVSHAALKIIGVQTPVKRERGGKCLHQSMGAIAESSGPGLAGWLGRAGLFLLFRHVTFRSMLNDWIRTLPFIIQHSALIISSIRGAGRESPTVAHLDE